MAMGLNSTSVSSDYLFSKEKVKSRFDYSFGMHFTNRAFEASIYADSTANASEGFNPASKFATPVMEGGNVKPVFLKANHPLVIVTKMMSASSEADMNRYDIMSKLLEARKAGKPYDSVIISREKGDEYDGKNIIVFDPTQIKSAIGNNGNFDGENPDIRYSKPHTARGYSPTQRIQAVKSVQAVADAIKAAWGNSPDVIVAFDMNDPVIPESVRNADRKVRKDSQSNVKQHPGGFYYKGKAYLFASLLKTPQQAARVLYHEVIGHHGLRGAFGPQLDRILQQVATMRKSDVIKKMARYAGGGVKLTERQAAEELLAEMAESNPQIGFVTRAVSAIRNWLRENLPSIFGNIELTDNDIIQWFLLPARNFVERGQTAYSSGGPAFSMPESNDGDIMFSLNDQAQRMGEAIKSMASVNIKDRAKFKMTDLLSIGLQALGRRQIVDIYGDMLPLNEYNRLVAQMEADKNESGAEADELATRWGKLPDERQLAEIMHDATLAKIDPDKPVPAAADAAQYQAWAAAKY